MYKKKYLAIGLLIAVITISIGTMALTRSRAASKDAPSNPWGYTLTPGGGTITKPDFSFCNYFMCTGDFWYADKGYVELCVDGQYSHSGGLTNDCANDNGEAQPLYYASKTTPTPTMPPTPTPVPASYAVWFPDPQSVVQVPGLVITTAWVHSANDVWIGGTRSVTPPTCIRPCYNYVGRAQVLEHFDGTAWMVSSTPAFDGYDTLSPYDMAGRASNDVWAVGNTLSTTNIEPLIEHFDGTTWSTMAPVYPTNDGPSVNTTIQRVYEFAPNKVYIIGSYESINAQTVHLFVNMYDGSQWNDVAVNRTARFLSLAQQGNAVVITLQLPNGLIENDTIG